MAASFNFCAHRNCEHNISLGHYASYDLVLCSVSVLSGKFNMVHHFLFSLSSRYTLMEVSSSQGAQESKPRLCKELVLFYFQFATKEKDDVRGKKKRKTK